MKLQNQVCTLEQGKRLKELGIRQDASHAAWLRNECNKETEFWCWPVEAQGITNRGYSSPTKGCLEGFSAFTVAELGVMIGKGTNAAAVLYDAVQGQMNRSHSFTIALSAQFVANCLIGMLETGFLAADEVNARLCSH